MSLEGQVERKWMAHFIDASFSGMTASWVRLGKDLEEYNIDLNPDVEVTKNILGEQSIKHKGYEITSEAEPYYAEIGDPLFEKIQNIIDTRATGDSCKTKSLEVHLWDEDSTSTGSYVAYKEDVYVIPTSHGGDTSGYQLPFTVYYAGNRVKGLFNPTTKTFTEDE